MPLLHLPPFPVSWYKVNSWAGRQHQYFSDLPFQEYFQYHRQCIFSCLQSTIHNHSRLLSDEPKKNNLSSALIVAPTRELALQIYEDAELIGKYTGLTFAQVVGGIDYKKQAEKLAEGPDIVICTPGRVIDYIKQGVFKTTGIKLMAT